MSLRRHLLGLLAASACAAGFPALAQSNNPPPAKHVRGTVDTLSGDKLVVKAAGGQDVTVDLAPDWKAIAVVPSSLSAVKPGTFIGTATTGPEDHLVSRSVVVFPLSMKGVGEGHYHWDLGPESMMTNAIVDAEVTKANGRELTLAYAGGERQVVVPPNAPVVTLEPAERSALTPGAKVFVFAATTDGHLTAKAVMVGKDGLIPPM